MNRSQFLTQKWNSYPILPSGVSFIGRVEEIRFGAEWSVTVLREGKLCHRNFSKLFIQEIPSIQPEKILIVGDLIAISDEGIVTLLAPHQQALPARPLRLESLQLWQDYIYWVREFFREQKFLEITTPYLVKCPGTEPSLDYFGTELVIGSRRQKVYLPTSPELHLKKALALGAEKIFEIKTCFRNGEVTNHHQPEFTMLEWYRSFESLHGIKKDVTELVSYLGRKMPTLKNPSGFDSFTIQDLFKRYCGFDLRPETTLSQLQDLAASLGVDVSSANQIDDYFFLIFIEKIEKKLSLERLSFVEKYPPYQAALARLTDEGWGDRFEVYWQGCEIANAFHELNDPTVQRQRFAEDLAKKRQMKKEEISLDEEFLQCLDAGMPPASGVALGLDRLFMAMTGMTKISDSRIFPIK